MSFSDTEKDPDKYRGTHSFVDLLSKSYDDYLVPTDGDPNDNWGDVFVRIRSTGITEHISISASGSGSNGDSGYYGAIVSADGRFVAFDSWAGNLVAEDTNGVEDVFVRECYSSP